jgi:NADH:ubiquinone oxidoreductase subunit 2 (subunit N)
MKYLIRKGIGSISVLAGLAFLCLVAGSIVVERPEDAVQYIGFGILLGLLFISVGLLFMMADKYEPAVVQGDR